MEDIWTLEIERGGINLEFRIIHDDEESSKLELIAESDGKTAEWDENNIQELIESLRTVADKLEEIFLDD